MHYRSLTVFSLAGWTRRIHTGLHVSRTTQDYATLLIRSYKGLSPATVQLSRCFYSESFLRYRAPTTPLLPKQYGFGLFPVRSPLLGESFLFSLPTGTKMFQFPAFASIIQWILSLQLSGFSHSDIHGSQVICTSP